MRLRYVSFVLIIVVVLACGGDGGSFSPVSPGEPVASVTVAPSPTTVYVGATVQLTATTKDAAGNVLTGRTISWASSDVSLATVNSSGLLLAKAVGTVTISATSEGKTGVASATIQIVPVETVTVTPGATSVGAGTAVQLAAVTKDAAGNVLNGRIVSWSSSDDAVASVNASGMVTGNAVGPVTITATSEGKFGTSSLSVITLIIPALDGGFSHTCGLANGGSAYCWGGNSSGELGNGTTVNSSIPVVVSGSLNFTSLIPGGAFTCALVSSGSTYCWGNNQEGALGNGGGPGSAVPVIVSGGQSFVFLSAGFGHICGLTAAGEAYCWGKGSDGQLGNGTNANKSIPTAVIGGHTFVSLGARGHHTCAVDTNGDAFCWGRNVNGQLGNGTTNPSSVPLAVSGGLKFTSVDAGGAHTCALQQSTQAAYCWGRNVDGELGDNTGVSSWLPVAVAGGHTFASLSARGAHTCGIRSDNTAHCWGDNAYGELGDGSNIDRLAPVLVTGGYSFSSVSSGATFTCGVTMATAGTYCWGDNSVGQLGDGTTNNSSGPVLVRGQ